MNGLGFVIDSKTSDFWVLNYLILDRTINILERVTMKAITKPEYAMLFFMLTPVITTLTYATYKLALEIWCIAYGLIY